MANVSEPLQRAYEEQYTEDLTAWRELGGKFKARNIVAVCAGRKFERVLECGAGEGSILKWLDEAGVFAELSAIEISDSGIQRIQARGLKHLREVKKFDGYRIPYPDQSFDLAICAHVLEHVEHPRELLRELARVSRFQVFEVPLDYAPGVDERADHFLNYGHINIFTPSTFRFLLRSEGYAILAERLTRSDPEVFRFIAAQNPGPRRGPARALADWTRPLRRAVRRVLWGRKRFDESEFSAYTCLAQRTGAPAVFGRRG